MAAKKYYAVAKGRVPGIYTDWPTAQAQVNGFAGARYKGFSSRREAVRWLQNPSGPTTAGTEKKKSAATRCKAALANEAGAEGAITIYTDGGARFNPGPGGYGIVIIANGEKRELSGGFAHTTNNRMELMGCIVALEQIADQSARVELYTDSSYVVNGITKGWAKGWRRRGWRKADNTPALNVDLWQRLLKLVEKRPVVFHWVKGHAGNPLNERCDRLAVAAAGGENLPEDLGYRPGAAP